MITHAAVVFAQPPQITSGLTYLNSSQNADGTWGSGASLVETTNATVTAIETLKILNQNTGTAYLNATAWLQGQSPQTVDYIAARVRALNLADGSANALIPALDPLKGAWGGLDGFETNTLDTASALKALKIVNYSDVSVINTALAYLTTNQNLDGGWGFTQGADSNVYMTAVVSATLQQFPQMSNIAIAVSKATSYLLAQHNADGGIAFAASTVYETALAYTALVAVTTNTTVLTGAVNYLTAAQSANGSWNDDPYSTALAIKALYLSENKPSPPPQPPAGGKITGTVIDSSTQKGLSGVAVVLESNQLINTATDVAGSFILPDTPPGAQKVKFSISGYASSTLSINAIENAVVSLGNIPLVSSYSTGTIAGTINDSSGKPLSGVAISVSGAWSGTAATGADGSFTFTFVTPGDVTITAAKSGFQPVTVTGTVYARTTFTFSPRLSTTSSPATTGTLVGRVVDSYWGVPIDHLPEEKGVTVTLSGGISVAVDANNGGYFTISNLPPNTYQVIAGMNGYVGQTFRVAITPGVTTDLGTIRLVMSASKMTLTGKVTDAVTGLPIKGAEVTLAGITLPGRTDFSGTYVITDIDCPKEFTLKAVATGYTGKSYTIGSSPWTQTMDIALSQQVTKGSLTGTVIDAATSQPLAGVALTLVSDPSVSVTTGSAGIFTFNAVPQGPQQVSLALSGYTTRTLTTAITVGVLNNVGNIALSVNQLAASVQGTVWDATANAPFGGVNIQTIANAPLQAVTSADGTYQLANVTPGTVTVAATSQVKPGYYGARLTGQLEPGGVLVFSPVLSRTMSPVVDVTVKSDKTSYVGGNTVGISVNLLNRQSLTSSAYLYLRVTDSGGVSVYETSVDLSLPADGTDVRDFSFSLLAGAQAGAYSVRAEVYGANGQIIGAASNGFGVAFSLVSVTPKLPAVFSAGANTVSFNLSNTGTLAISAGSLDVTLKDPDGKVVWNASQSFSLNLGENRTLTYTVSIPALKFGVYTLSYSQRDETKAGQVIDIPLPNTVAIAPLFDNNSRRIRETANLMVTLNNTGRFNLDTGSGLAVMVTVPDAAYEETKALSPAPAVGNASGSTLLFRFLLPETMKAGQHGTKITITLASGSTFAQTTQLPILESSLSLSPIQTAYATGVTIVPVINNSGGVDTSVQYKLGLYDAKSALIVEKNGNENVAAGSSLSLSLAIPAGAVGGNYNLIVNYQDMKTGKTDNFLNPISISGVNAAIQLRTNKQDYMLAESITGLSTITNSGSQPLTNGKLHLQVVRSPGTENTKTWTSKADFQTGVRNGVDTYGVNDWIVPDDDFSGASIDTNKWNIGGNVSIQSGRLLVDTMQATNSSGISSKWQLEGDFDIQIDFLSNSSADWVGAQLYVYCDNSWVSIGNYAATGYASQVAINGVQQAYVTGGSSSNSGRFRIARTTNVIATYYWGGTSWIALNNFTSSALVNPSSVGMTIYRTSNFPGASAAFDNFKVNSGRIKTENQAVDSVRLLPLNDNFDDGVFNEDRWIVTAGPKPTENFGLAQLLSSAAIPANAFAHRSLLSGDFRAVSVYKNYNVSPTLTIQARYVMQANAGDSAFYINRQSNDSSHGGGEIIVSLSQVSNSWQMTNELPYTLSSGMFRLRREGSTAYTDYWDGAQWATQHSRSAFPSDPSSISIYNYSQYSMPTIKSDLDVFYTDKGTYSENGKINLKFDSGTSGNKWGKLLYSSTQPVGTSIKLRTRTAETEAGLATSIWSEDIIASGSAVNSPAARWIEIEGALSTSNTNVTPLLQNLTVTYDANPGEILWQADVPINLAQGVSSDLNNMIGMPGIAGKFFLQGTLTSSTGQTIANSEYPFYIAKGNTVLNLNSDKKLYKPGETVTLTGEVKNLVTVDAANLTLVIKAQPSGGALQALLTTTITIPAGGSYPFTATTTAGADGVVTLTGMVTQNSATMAEISDQYEVTSPYVTATLTAPDAAGSIPFVISLSMTNSSKTDTSIVIEKSFNSPAETIIVPAGQTKLLQYSQQINADALYTVTLSGDIKQTLTKAVSYLAAPVPYGSVGAKIVTDKISYNPNEQATITATVTGMSSNYIFSNLVVKTIILGATGQSLYSDSRNISSLIGAQRFEIKNSWNTGDNPKGAYTLKVVVLEGATSIASAQSTFAIGGSADNGTGVSGSVTAQAASIEAGLEENISFSIANRGNQVIPAIILQVLIIDPDSSTVIKTFNAFPGAISLAINAAQFGKVSFSTEGLPLKPLLVIFQSSIQGINKSVASTIFTVTDTTKPVLTVSTLSNGTYTNNETMNIAGTVKDNSGVKELRISDVIVPVNQDGSFSYALILKKGTNLITVTATDNSGNQSIDKRTITLDKAAPVLLIIAPSDNAKTAKNIVDITGTVDEASTVTIVVKGKSQAVMMDINTFTATINLEPGYNTLEVTATDRAGNQSSQKRTVVYDDQKPSLAIIEPNQDLRTNEANMMIKGTVFDALTAVNVTISMDNETFIPDIVNGAFQQEVAFTSEKSYAIVATATNEAGSTTSVQRNVIYDITPPGLTFNPVTTPTLLAEQVVSGTREANSKVTLTCSTAVIVAVEYPTATTWSSVITNLAMGDNNITVTAVDETGNISTLTAKIILTTPSSDPLFSYAVFGNTSVTMSGASYTDSYKVVSGVNDSRKYHEQCNHEHHGDCKHEHHENSHQGCRGDCRHEHHESCNHGHQGDCKHEHNENCGRNQNGHVATNSIKACSILLNGGSAIYGKALVGSGGNPSKGICLKGGSFVYNNNIGALPKAKEMAPMTDPGGGIAMGALNLTHDKRKTLAEGTYRFSTISVSGSAELTLAGKTTIYIDGNLTVSGSGTIAVSPGALVKVYVNGNRIDISGGSIVNESKTPKSLSIYGTAGLKKINLSGGARLHALIYAPTAAISISGGQHTFGSVLGNTVNISGSGAVHYDESLLD